MIDNLPKIEIGCAEKIIGKPHKAIVFTGRRSSQALPCSLKDMKKVFVSSTTLADMEEMASGQGSDDAALVIGAGGGAAIDAAKFYAAKKDLRLIAIPTMISTDAFLTNAAGVREDGCVKYIPCKHPDLVIIDPDILMKAPEGANASGAGDVLSIYTGLYDWKLAHEKTGEPFDQNIYEMSRSILAMLEKNADEIGKESKEGLMILLNLLCQEVSLCNFWGNSRPEEGSEHFFAYSAENYAEKGFLHGQAVAKGILIMSKLQGQDVNYAATLIRKLGIDPSGFRIGEDDLGRCLMELAAFTREHKLPFSIIDVARR